MSVNTAVVYHSGYGHTELVAQAVARGAEKSGSTALIKISPEGKIEDKDWDTLNGAAAIIFGAPTYMGSASGQFKIFADASSKAWFTRAWQNKVAGGFTNSLSLSGDKLATLQQMSVLAAQQGMLWVSLGEAPPSGGTVANQRDADAINRLGSALGVMTQAENVAPDGSIAPGDLKTAELYGERVAGFAKKLAA